MEFDYSTNFVDTPNDSDNSVRSERRRFTSSVPGRTMGVVDLLEADVEITVFHDKFLRYAFEPGVSGAKQTFRDFVNIYIAAARIMAEYCEAPIEMKDIINRLSRVFHR